MNRGLNKGDFIDYLEVGLSLISLDIENPHLSEWVFVNEARCRMVGMTREEILASKPMGITTRESLAQFDTIDASIRKYGYFKGESTLLHKSQQAVPVLLHISLIERGGRSYLLTEQHDIREFKANEDRLRQTQAHSMEMLKLIEIEKRQLRQNIRGNVDLVAFPLIAQLRIKATADQKVTLDLLESRIRHVIEELGVHVGLDGSALNLTRRQIMICELIRGGSTSKEIARALDCSVSTINNHRNIIRRKLGLSGTNLNLEAYLTADHGRRPAMTDP